MRRSNSNILTIQSLINYRNNTKDEYITGSKVKVKSKESSESKIYKIKKNAIKNRKLKIKIKRPSITATTSKININRKTISSKSSKPKIKEATKIFNKNDNYTIFSKKIVDKVENIKFKGPKAQI